MTVKKNIKDRNYSVCHIIVVKAGINIVNLLSSRAENRTIIKF